MLLLGWAYFGLIETQNKHQTTLELMESDLEKNTEFRINGHGALWDRFRGLRTVHAYRRSVQASENATDTRDEHDKQGKYTIFKKTNGQSLQDIERLKDKQRKKYTNETVISSVVALCMFIAGEIKEHRLQDSMSDCLKGKRVAERDQYNECSHINAGV